MKDPGDRNLHLVMGVLLAVSLIVDQQEFEAWRAGTVSMVTLAIAVVWMGRFAWEGFRRRDAGSKVLRNRLAAVEERVDELERDARQRRSPF
jgi:hypothetical protein